jgi:DNA-binding NarL/FixJ family response regulator
MARICCLAAIDPKDISLLSAALKGAGEPALTVVARLEVAELSRLVPDVLVVDVDALQVDPLEMVRQLRFVLPESVIVVYTRTMRAGWGKECHLAGASCLLSKDSPESQLVAGLRRAIHGGCFTDPRLDMEAM